MFWLLLAIVVHPAYIYVEANPGEQVRIPLTFVGDGEVQIEGSTLLPIREELVVQNKVTHEIRERVPPDTKPGTYQTYLYVAEKTNKPIATATAITLDLLIKETKEATPVIGTEKTFRSTSPFLIGAIVFLVVLGVILLWRTNVKNELHSSTTEHRNPQQSDL